MGEPTLGGRAGPSSRDQKLRRERGQKLEDISVCTKSYTKKKDLLGKRDGEEERDGAQHDDKRATTVAKLAEGNSSSLPITCGRWLWMGSTAWEERRRSSTCTKKWAATSSVCRKRGVVASLLFFKLDMLFTTAASTEATGKGRRAKVELSISRAEARPPEFISDRLLKVTLELCGRARAVTFVVGYAPTDTQSVGKKNAFWTALERVVKEVLEHEQLFVLMDTNARTGRRGGGKLGSEEFKVLGAYGRDNLNDNGERLLLLSANHELALLNTFFSTAKNAISHTFNRRGKKRIDYILTRQRDGKLVRDVTVHPQPSFLPISYHNIVTAHVKLLDRFARNRPVREAKGPPPIDRQRLTTDPICASK